MSNTPLAHLRAILVLPFNVLVVIPSAIAWFGRAPLALAGAWEPRLWLGLACLAAGLGLMSWTIRRFFRVGGGTLAPWDPTQTLVVLGVYRHVRNPMITGVVLNLVGEALVLGSSAIGLWAALFFAVNAVFIPLFEEPDLERRFGEPYRRYRENVPRWIPRLRPWTPEAPGS